MGEGPRLEPVQDLLHSQVALQDPAVPQAPLHVIESEALQHQQQGLSAHFHALPLTVMCM